MDDIASVCVSEVLRTKLSHCKITFIWGKISYSFIVNIVSNELKRNRCLSILFSSMLWFYEKYLAFYLVSIDLVNLR